MEKEKLEYFRKKLLKMRENLLNKAKRFKKDSFDLSTDGIQDMADAASSTYNMDILLSLSDSEINLLKEIDHALDKISQDIYGICEECQEEINEKRLEVNPTARFCLNCKKMMEEKGL